MATLQYNLFPPPSVSHAHSSVKAIQKLNETELTLGLDSKTSRHDKSDYWRATPTSMVHVHMSSTGSPSPVTPVIMVLTGVTTF